MSIFLHCLDICPLGEEMDNCFNPCPPDTCDSLEISHKCPPINLIPCKKGCKCKKGYRRNKKGICVPYNQCRMFSNLTL